MGYGVLVFIFNIIMENISAEAIGIPWSINRDSDPNPNRIIALGERVDLVGKDWHQVRDDCLRRALLVARQ